ncbi:site-2 protease family protein [Motilimonas cestriensis]|uniref:site-2 protease family protein n=1 Tax=Motilimonas cestriensis TaxID=2742685 RepID=UPI003DA6A0E7
MTSLFLSIFLAVSIHLFSMAGVARLFGIKVNSISIGYGPKILRLKNLTLSLLPFGGYVRMQDSRVESLDEQDHVHAFDKKNRLIRALIPFSGCFSLFIVSAFFLGNMTTFEFYSGINQITSGALHPISIGSTYIANAINFANNNAPTIVFSFVAIKLCALNSLPLPILNGGQIIMELLELPEKINEILFKIGAIIFLLLLTCWGVAAFSSVSQ